MMTAVRTPGRCAARAHSNVALVKYWGKRDEALNLPAVGSISVTLEALVTDTEVVFDPRLGRDSLDRNGHSDSDETVRVSAVLDRVRARAGVDLRAAVTSRNSFPTGAGLASSASGFAALALAAVSAAGLELEPDELSVLARLGSGSAPRSLYGGFVEMRRGALDDGSDAVARPLFAADHWPLEVLVTVVSETAKAVGSSVGMGHSAGSSPFFPAWLDGAAGDLEEARAAIAGRDLERLGAVAEHSCLKMHAVCMAARPGLVYWQPATLAVMELVRRARERGLPVFFTIDAGPQVKVFCEPTAADRLEESLTAVPGVQRVIRSRLGPPARIVEADR
jgi:diphosphomevalonate decarboxylase